MRTYQNKIKQYEKDIANDVLTEVKRLDSNFKYFKITYNNDVEYYLLQSKKPDPKMVGSNRCFDSNTHKTYYIDGYMDNIDNMNCPFRKLITIIQSVEDHYLFLDDKNYFDTLKIPILSKKEQRHLYKICKYLPSQDEYNILASENITCREYKNIDDILKHLKDVDKAIYDLKMIRANNLEWLIKSLKR